MPRALQTSGMAVPLASSASASRSLRMICSGVWRIRFIGSPPALSGENDSHIGWTSPWGAGQPRPLGQGHDEERGAGIEPTSPAWKAGALPLDEPRSGEAEGE